MNNRIIMSVLVLLTILTIGAVNATDTNVSSDTGDIAIMSSGDDEILSVESDSDVLGVNSSKYSDLAAEIGSGGNIELMHDYYTYDTGSTIQISTPNSVIDGKGAVIDMTGAYVRVFSITASGVTLKNLTIRNSNFDGNGGAVFFGYDSYDSVVENCNFVNNSATNYGGAAYFSYSGEVTGCKFVSNNASNAGAVYMSNGTIVNCNFTNNSAGAGGAIEMDFGSVKNCNFTNNSAESGGAICFNGECSVSNSNFVNCSASEYGGAIYFVADNKNYISNSSFVGCSAGDGGGIYNLASQCNVLNCSFEKCSARGDGDSSGLGGAVSNKDGVLRVSSSSFKNNGAKKSGGSIYGATVFNCEISDNINSAIANSDNFAEVISDEMVSNDEGIVVLEFPEDAEGTVEIFLNGNFVAVVEIVNGIAKIDLSDYKGEIKVSFVYSGDDKYLGFIKESNVTVYINPARISAKNTNALYAAGQKFTVTVYSDEGKVADGASVEININGKKFKTITASSNGVASFKATQVPGTYKVQITSLNKTVTKTLTVKHLVALKKVTVKRSAKKLVLTATLAKVNKKYLKNKKITFKFNGKKYTAKTNKKGVAKVTVKSSVLKKLKKGKKVTYQATYLKDTVKRTVKVKK